MLQSLGSTVSIFDAALRSSEAQGLLAELSALPNISFVASMDHVNAPLLWDKQMAARFDWLFFDVTNYTPYHLETANVPSLLVGRRQVNFYCLIVVFQLICHIDDAQITMLGALCYIYKVIMRILMPDS